VLLSRSTYCLVLPGDGWVSLFEEAVIHGCIPVYVTGGPRDLHPPFADQLKWGSFSLSVRREELPRLPQILTNVDPKQLLNMQRRAARIWHRLAWLDHPALLAQAAGVMRSNLATFPQVASDHKKMEKMVAEGKMGDTIFPTNGVRLLRRADAGDDAFNTVMQFLYSKSREMHGDSIRSATLAAVAAEDGAPLTADGGAATVDATGGVALPGGENAQQPPFPGEQLRLRRRRRRRRRRQAGLAAGEGTPEPGLGAGGDSQPQQQQQQQQQHRRRRRQGGDALSPPMPQAVDDLTDA